MSILTFFKLNQLILKATHMVEKITKTEAEWKKILTPEQYEVMRKGGTEPAFKNAFHDNKRRGTYLCAACSLPLFRSNDKYDSGTGWPSFSKPIEENHVEYKEDCRFLGLGCRTEVLCARCGSHLGHVFDDGPEPTGKRFCMNSISFNFKPNE